jgi:hypothetical protein
MPTGRNRSEEKPTQAGPRNQRDIDALDELRNDTSNLANYQTDLTSAQDANAALGDSTGNARRSSEAAGANVDDNAVTEAREAQRENRGDRQAREQKERF